MARRLNAEAVAFLLSGESPVKLAKEDPDLLRAVLDLVREDPPMMLALTDPGVYRRLRERITDLRIQGWGFPREE